MNRDLNLEIYKSYENSSLSKEINPEIIIQGVLSFFKSAADVQINKEVEITNRLKIESDLELALSLIENNLVKEKMYCYNDLYKFDKTISLIKEAINLGKEMNSEELIKSGLDTLNKLIQNN
ncbi:MAG: hypothetical protein ACRC7N_03215 [Clostridium sp.]